MSTNLALPVYNNARTHPERLALSVNQRSLTYERIRRTRRADRFMVPIAPGG